jgi:hypothetical protein
VDGTQRQMALISIISSITHKKIGFPFIGNLIFCFLLIGCGTGNEKSPAPISIEWTGNKATGIIIPRDRLKNIPADSIENAVLVKLPGNIISVLGNYDIKDKVVVFRSLIHFPRGLQYEIWLKDQLIDKVSIPAPDPENKPAIVKVYPDLDTVPENLLKIHIRFSKPMQEGEVLKNIMLVRNDHDTMGSVFLDLQPELWNNTKTILTLWLDPGRIKRDLQPNKKMGAPLRKGDKYELIISKDWQSAEGIALQDTYRKRFVAGARDNSSPDVAQWIIKSEPVAGTDNPLRVLFNESLDYVLMTNTIRVTDSSGKALNTRDMMGENERFIMFYPPAAWQPGHYTIEIESRLEDLAGNNLDRLFDNDLSKEKKTSEQKIFKKKFVIE